MQVLFRFHENSPERDASFSQWYIRETQKLKQFSGEISLALLIRTLCIPKTLMNVDLNHKLNNHVELGKTRIFSAVLLTNEKLYLFAHVRAPFS